MPPTDPRTILQQYWGYPDFRPGQRAIIEDALAGKDTLALLPTGGGKSICYQVPVLCGEGMGLVVSPLIALMDDQVQNLRKRGIRAVALHSGLSYRELDLALDNAAEGFYRFLYVSPERLQSELFLARLERMPVRLLAVDEAHCISQWGYDFRPPYLEIAQLRKQLPEVPVLALTATATPAVARDIQEKLAFKEPHLRQQSFRRPELFYHLVHSENKWNRALQALQKIPGTAIAYLRHRRSVVELAQWLQAMGIPAQYYHGGLPPQERQKRQESWLQNQTRVMVCTNAFGMGIDKPDVRLVLHLELPDSLEAYFQEAGRAGRDRQTAHAVTYVGPDDVHQLRVRHLQSFPSLQDIRHLYQVLANYFQLATGSGAGQTFGLDMGAFLRQYRLPALKTHQGLRILSKEGFISLSDGYAQPSRLRILADNTTLYDYQLRYPKQDLLIKTLTRSYGGLDVEYSAIDEATLAARLKTNEETVTAQLHELHRREMVDYQPRRQASSITFERARVESRHLRISPEHLKQRYQQLEKRIEAVIRYTEEDQTCRSLQLLHYFGEKGAPACGRCDVCRRQKRAVQGASYAATRKVIYKTLQEEAPLRLEEALEQWRPQRKAEETLRWMVDEGEVQLHNGVLHLPVQTKDKTSPSKNKHDDHDRPSPA